MDLQRFKADYAGNALPAATVEINANLLHAIGQDIVASHTFLQAEPAAGPTWPRCWTPSRAGSARSTTTSPAGCW